MVNFLSSSEKKNTSNTNSMSVGIHYQLLVLLSFGYETTNNVDLYFEYDKNYKVYTHYMLYAHSIL